MSLYLEIPLALVNPFFLKWLTKQRVQVSLIAFIMFLVICSLFLAFGLVVKLLFIAILMAYIYYTIDKRYFYLRYFLYLSILVGVAQVLFLFINPDIAHQISPTALSKKIWGAYATPTFFNANSDFSIIPRASGLSREGGFFASLIICTFLLHKWYNGDLFYGKWDKRIFYSFFIIGFIFSFSKISVMFFVALIVFRFRFLINLVPRIVLIFTVFCCLGLFWEKYMFILNTHESFLHRFAGYVILFDVDEIQLLSGVSSPDEVNSFLSKGLVSKGFNEFAGVVAFLLHYGLVIFFAWLLLLIVSGVSSTGMLIFIIITMGVTPYTNQNFVVIAYLISFICFKSDLRFSLNSKVFTQLK